MKKSKLYFSIIAIVYYLFWIALFFGWVMNIVQICKFMTSPVTGLFIVKVVGIIVAPLGVIMGYIGL